MDLHVMTEEPQTVADLHNRDHDPRAGMLRKRFHIRTHFVRKRGRIYYRRRAPEALRAIVGKVEVWRSARMDGLIKGNGAGPNAG